VMVTPAAARRSVTSEPTGWALDADEDRLLVHEAEPDPGTDTHARRSRLAVRARAAPRYESPARSEWPPNLG
jgi:hypothetical protein